MAIRPKPTSTPITTQITRCRILAVSTVILVLVFLGLSSQLLLFDKPGSHHTHTPKKLHTAQEVLNVANGHDRPLVAYAYAESDNARENLKFFLKRGLHAGADFIFIFNGETDASDLVPAHLTNVKVVKRDNTCYDMGAFGEVLTTDRLWTQYKRFITLNASLRGPFLPIWSNECWTDAILNKVTEKNKVSGVHVQYLHLHVWISVLITFAQLVGLTYNCLPSPHVQSMLLATDQIGMQILLDPALAHSVPLDTPPWGAPEDPVGYSVCYENYGQAASKKIHLLFPGIEDPDLLRCHCSVMQTQ